MSGTTAQEKALVQRRINELNQEAQRPAGSPLLLYPEPSAEPAKIAPQTGPLRIGQAAFAPGVQAPKWPSLRLLMNPSPFIDANQAVLKELQGDDTLRLHIRLCQAFNDLPESEREAAQESSSGALWRLQQEITSFCVKRDREAPAGWVKNIAEALVELPLTQQTRHADRLRDAGKLQDTQRGSR